mgnify:CR=1 FL=1|jgi:hypothetical protein
MDSICLPSEVNVADVKVGILKSLSNGGKMAFLNHKEKQFVIQTPEMYGPFGMNSYTNDDTGITKYSLDLSFRNLEDRDSLQSLMKFLNDLDDLVVQTAFDNSQLWFKKKYSSKEVVEALYTSCVKYPKDKETGEVIDKYPPTFKINLPHRDGKFKLEAYDKKANVLDLSKITTKGAKFVSLLQCGGVWVAGGKFGLTWRVVQIQVTPPSTISGFSIKKVENDNIADEDEDIDNTSAQLTETTLDDSDGDV